MTEHEIYVAAFGEPVARHIEKLTQDARGASENVADARRSAAGAHGRDFGATRSQDTNAAHERPAQEDNRKQTEP